MSGKFGSIMLFFRDLPPDVSRRDLRMFVSSGLRESGVRGNPLVQVCGNCSILRVFDPATRATEYHGFVEVKPARVAMMAIGILNGRPLRGTPVEVRRYRQRSPLNERRAAGSHLPSRGELELAGQIRRDRRRPNLQIDLVETTPALHETAQLTVLS